ncbi:hypothetical protein BKA62DRAFT_715339 [Auriculariales sp. MPI-PUGE-AT-0066]|nr:hypothetical protein BKA62DRAFT_715339 [Auriculariales sp. MPI-PUGE-AT-0066]
MELFASLPDYPALVLSPLTDTFQAKHILLRDRVKIGRQSDSESTATPRNGYFDSEVISKQHAEVWAEDGKIWIKDLGKSITGTYINGRRLALAGVISEAFELHTSDILELGNHTNNEDNCDLRHRQVAARVTCLVTAEEASSYAHVEEVQRLNQELSAAHKENEEHKANVEHLNYMSELHKNDVARLERENAALRAEFDGLKSSTPCVEPKGAALPQLAVDPKATSALRRWRKALLCC